MPKKQIPIEHIRHSLSHVLAMAVLERWPGAKLGVGPVIENGCYYDFDVSRPNVSRMQPNESRITDEDLPDIEKRMRKIIAKNLDFIAREVSFGEAREFFKKQNQPYKLDLIDDLEMYGTTDVRAHKKIENRKSEIGTNKLKTVWLYQTGNFVDLCAGGHVANTRDLNPDAFKIMKTSGAYWRGSEENPMLTRIYVAAFRTKKELTEHLEKFERAKQCDHRVLGERLEFFMIDDEIGKGLPLWLPKGYFARHKLEEYMYALEQKAGYLHVLTPHLAKEDLYKKSGHLKHYKNDMYAPVEIENERYYLKPMNCPHHHAIYRHRKRSYRDLPFRIAEFGTVYRYERSGVLTGLMRVRGFTQNDAHIYTTEELLEKEVISVLKLHKKVYGELGIKNYWYRLSLPDFSNKEKFGDVQNKEMWKRGSEALKRALKTAKLKFVEAVGEATFYGPKIDIQIKDIYGREDTISTVQTDYYSAPRFELVYTDRDGMEKPVVIIHRAILGSFDRFFAVLLEQTCGNLPFWLSPAQIAVIPVSDKFNAYGREVYAKLIAANIRAELWDQNESVGKKIREGEMQKIPYLLVVGKREKKKNAVAVRERGRGDIGMKALDKFMAAVLKEIQNKA